MYQLKIEKGKKIVIKVEVYAKKGVDGIASDKPDILKAFNAAQPAP
jgi:hypothetical protein